VLHFGVSKRSRKGGEDDDFHSWDGDNPPGLFLMLSPLSQELHRTYFTACIHIHSL
jgi:hypothetical protein